jgi:Protein of unknown function (DUF3015)
MQYQGIIRLNIRLQLLKEYKMKKIIAGIILSTTASASFAVSPGGDSCGWGNMLFKGQSGLPIHFVASTTNGTSGNKTFGMTTGTNGCSTSGVLTYGGSSMIDLSAVMDEFSEDVAKGDGEVLSAFVVSLGVQPEHRQAFKNALHTNFSSIFPNQNVTTEQVLQSIGQVIAEDKSLAGYVS